MTALGQGRTGDSQAGLIAAAHLDGEASVTVFRTLLDALARPGTVLAGLALLGGAVPPALVPALALADVDLRVAVVGDDAAVWSEVLRAVTGARPSSLATASIIVALRELTPSEVLVVECGDAMHPELSCRLILACRSLHEGSDVDAPHGATSLRLTGPGIPDSRVLHLSGIDHELFETLVTANRAFPAGIDTHLVDDAGQVAGLPRSTMIEILATGAG